jgi:hypothetical protein
VIVQKHNQDITCTSERVIYSANGDKELKPCLIQRTSSNVDIIGNASEESTLMPGSLETVSIISTQSRPITPILKRIKAAKQMLQKEGTRTNSQICLNIAPDQNKTKISVENRLTRISLGIVYLFIVCHIWRLIPTVYEALFSKDGTVISEWPKWLFHVYHLSHTLIVFNSAVNFILYVVR